MKATTQPAKFQPIVLTLETEAEAKAIFAVLNHAKLTQILGIADSPYPGKIGFPEYLDTATVPLHAALNKALK